MQHTPPLIEITNPEIDYKIELNQALTWFCWVECNSTCNKIIYIYSYMTSSFEEAWALDLYLALFNGQAWLFYSTTGQHSQNSSAIHYNSGETMVIGHLSYCWGLYTHGPQGMANNVEVCSCSATENGYSVWNRYKFGPHGTQNIADI